MDTIEIIQHLNKLHIIRTQKINGQYYTIYCPIHSNGQERHPSCGILLRDQYRGGRLYKAGFCHCFACGFSGTLQKMLRTILSNRDDISKEAHDWIYQNILNESSEDYEEDSLIPKELFQDNNSNSPVLKSLNINETQLKEYDKTDPYMYQRKLTDTVIERFRVGVDYNYIPYPGSEAVPCITFPVRDEKGNVIMICRRAIYKKNFYMPSNITKPLYGIYELPEKVNKILICESCFNVLTSYVYGIPAVGLFGTGTSYQMDLLKQLDIEEFIIALDNDNAGIKGRERIQRSLKDKSCIVSYIETPKGKDVNDLTKDEFDYLINDRRWIV